MPMEIPSDLLGFVISGDFAGFTVYTDRFGTKVWFPKSPPKEPASVLQVNARNRFRQAVANWKALTPEQKSAWERMSLKAAVCATGHNLFVSASLKVDQNWVDTLVRQTGIEVEKPPFIENTDPRPEVKNVW